MADGYGRARLRQILGVRASYSAPKRKASPDGAVRRKGHAGFVAEVMPRSWGA
jgi:hypothetical protein